MDIPNSHSFAYQDLFNLKHGALYEETYRLLSLHWLPKNNKIHTMLDLLLALYRVKYEICKPLFPLLKYPLPEEYEFIHR